MHSQRCKPEIMAMNSVDLPVSQWQFYLLSARCAMSKVVKTKCYTQHYDNLFTMNSSTESGNVAE